MRRSTQIISGHNYYRKANEILYTDQQSGKLGVFDEIKKMPNGTLLAGVPTAKIWPLSSVYHEQIKTKSGGIEFGVPVAASSAVYFQPNIGLDGDFSFQFDITQAGTAGTTFKFRVYLYTEQIVLKSTGFYYYFLQYASGYRYGYIWNVTGEEQNGTSGSGGAENIIKLRFRRSGTTIYSDKYESSWVGNGSHDMTRIGTVYPVFYLYCPSSSDYLSATLTNFTLNSGRTQILW